MKASEIRKLSETEMAERLNGYKEELFNLRWQTVSHQNQNPKRMREVRRNIARILTLMGERKRKESGNE